MARGSTVEQLCRTAARPLWEDAPDTTRELVRCSVRDWIAVAVAGSVDPQVRAVMARTASAAPGSRFAATVIGAGVTASVGEAARLGGIAGHVLDYDDTSTGTFEGHPSAVLCPPLLAAGEASGATLGDLFAAYVNGAQVCQELGAWVGPAHYAAGWHSTSTIGSVGAAAAVARLLGLDEDGLAHAIAFAATQVGGVKVAFGTFAKPLQVGRACAVAVDAASAAATGTAAPLGAIDEHPILGGLRDGGREQVDLREDARVLAVEQTLIKWHAACHSTHAALEAWSRLGIDANEVEWVEIGVRPDLLDVCAIDHPTSALELKFSLRGVAAMAMVGIDTADPATFGESTLRSPAWAAELGKVSVRPTDLDSEWQTVLTVGTRGRPPRSVSVDLRKANDPGALRERLDEKYRRLVPPVLGAGPADDLWKLLDDPDDVPVLELVTLLGVAR